MKKYIVALISLILLTTSVQAENSNIDMANNWLIENSIINIPYFESINDGSKVLNSSEFLVGTRKTIVYGEPYGDPITIDGGIRNRYLGYTMSDAPFTNYMYPDDTSGTTSYYDRGYNVARMVKTPWDNFNTMFHKAVTTTGAIPADDKFCGKPEFEPYIKEGLRIRSRDEMARQGINVDYPVADFTAAQIESINWHEYMYIIQPPTDYSWGSGVLFRDNGAGYLTVPIPPNPYGAPTPTPTITTTPVPTPSPLPSPAGVIKFDPPSCEWRNTPLPVRVYVDGSKSTTKSDSALRQYSYTTYVFYPDPPRNVQESRTESTYWGFSQTWSIGNINVNGSPLPSLQTIADNSSVTVSQEGVGQLSASLVGWTAGSKTWNSGYPPIGSWSSGSPSGNTSSPSERYNSSSGTYKIDLTVPTVTFDWSNQDWIKGSQHGFIYLPDNRINATLGDNLSGVIESKYSWSKDATFPDPATMTNMSITTAEGINSTTAASIRVHDTQDRIKDWYLHVYVRDRAGNITTTTQEVYIECSLQNFRITDITDRQWEDVFWNPDFATGTATGAYYPVSKMPVDYHPTKKIIAKKGYAFYFDMTSKGLNGAADTVNIKPRFYYLKDLTNAGIQAAYEVDLFYDLGKEYLIQYGSSRDKFIMNYKMSDGSTYNIGGLGGLTLNNNVRSITDTKNATWFGRFALMSSTKALKKGYPLVVNGKVNSALLTKGYILVNFTIEGYKNGVKVFDYNPDQWTAEGGPKNTLYYTGDTIIFNLEYSALDDYGTGTDR